MTPDDLLVEYAEHLATAPRREATVRDIEEAFERALADGHPADEAEWPR